jgi:hypothetical protein
MQRLLHALQPVGWLLVLAGLTAAIVIAFRSVGQPANPAGEATGDALSPGYPPPTAAAPLPTDLPPGYPPPPTPLPTLSETEQAAVWATEFAAMTASVPATPTPQGVVIGPRTITNLDGEFQLELASGWRAYLGRTTSIINYDDEAFGGEGNFPKGGLKIQIEVSELSSGQTVEQWVSQLIANVTAAHQDSGLPIPTFAEPQPDVLGNYEGISYDGNGQSPFMHIILPVSDGRLIIIEIRPSDSPALPEGLELLSTLVVLPEKAQ